MTKNPYDWFHLAEYAWIFFLVYWLVSAWRLKAVKRREPYGERFIQIIFMATVYVLMFDELLGRGWWGTRFLVGSAAMGAIGVAVTWAGIAMAVWARRHLGKNWSAMVTVKEGHELICTGPYRRIRHPIYTGMLLALAGTTVALGEYRGLISLGLALTILSVKAKKEERFLRQEFGEKFNEHAQHTGMFLPKWT